MSTTVYWVDFAIGTGTGAAVFLFYFWGKLKPFWFKLFLLGTFLGFLWEVPLCLIDYFEVTDLFIFHTPPPVPMFLVNIAHSLWDGGLFLIGAWLVVKICRPPHFASFRLPELAVLIAWGQAQELAVELVSTTTGLWEYIVHPWSPALFYFNGQAITLMPQVIWLIAPVVFYLIALKLRAAEKEKKKT